MIKIDYYTAEEAILHGCVYAVNKKPVAAYDAYNQAIFYQKSLLETLRPCQVALYKEIQGIPENTTPRGIQIVQEEAKFNATSVNKLLT